MSTSRTSNWPDVIVFFDLCMLNYSCLNFKVILHVLNNYVIAAKTTGRKHSPRTL